jgi:hypothetical protein
MTKRTDEATFGGEMSELESNAMSAVDNEADTLTGADKDQAAVHALDNAVFYADQYGVSVAEFRATVERPYGVKHLA